MDATSVKEKILKAVREALIEKDDDLFHETEPTPNSEANTDGAVTFAEKIIAKGGAFLFCEKSKDLLQGVIDLFKDNDLSNVYCHDQDLSEVLNACQVNHFTEITKDHQIDYVVAQADALIADRGSIVLSFDNNAEHVVFASGATLVVFATTNQVVNSYADVPKLISPHHRNDIPGYIHVIEHPATKNKLEFPRQTYVFLRYVK